MNTVFRKIGKIYEISTKGNTELITDPLEDHILKSSYQLAMIGDIATTIAITEDIIERDIDSEKTSGKYV